MAYEDPNERDDEKQPEPIPPIGQPMLAPMLQQAPPSAMPAPIPPPMAMPGGSPQLSAPAMAVPSGGRPQPVAPAPAMAAPTLPTLEKSGIQKLWDKTADLNPFAKFMARAGTGALGALDVAGESLLPRAAMLVPESIIGTRIANNQAAKRAETEQAMQTAKQKVDAETETAGAAKSRAETEAAKEHWEELHPTKQGITPEELFMTDALHGGQNGGPKTDSSGKPYTYLTAHAAWKQAEQDTKPDKMPTEVIKRKVGGVDHNILIDKATGKDIQDLGELGEKAPAEPGSFMPLYDAKGRVTGAWNPKDGRVINAPGNLPGTTAQGQHITTEAQTALDKKTAPLKAVVDEADQAATFKDMADKGNAEADVNLALSFFKAMRSSQSGGSGIRFTQQENNLIMGSRGLMDSLEVKGNKVFSNGQPLAKKQRQEILDVINVHKKAAQRQLQELQGGGGSSDKKSSFKEF